MLALRAAVKDELVILRITSASAASATKSLASLGASISSATVEDLAGRRRNCRQADSSQRATPLRFPVGHKHR